MNSTNDDLDAYIEERAKRDPELPKLVDAATRREGLRELTRLSQELGLYDAERKVGTDTHD